MVPGVLILFPGLIMPTPHRLVPCTRTSSSRSRPRLILERLEDRLVPDAQVFTVINTWDVGVGSLRWAITQTNNNGNPNDVDLIQFHIFGDGPYVITPQTTPLPAITQKVKIDGYSQPLTQANTLEVGNNANIRIVIAGETLSGVQPVPNDLAGLAVNADGCTIQGLAIRGFSAGIRGEAIRITGKDNSILGCYLGTDATGLAAAPNREGISIMSGPGNAIGAGTPASRNVIAGNAGSGITIWAPGNRVQGNYIGVDKTGQGRLGNQTGVRIFHSENLIGGDTALQGNVISANREDGISLDRQRPRPDPIDDNKIQGNLVGTDATGMLARGNNRHGISVIGAKGTIIGEAAATPGQAPGNVISGNGEHGIYLHASPNVGPEDPSVDTHSTRIYGNVIGLRMDGREALPAGDSNGKDGIFLNSSGGLGRGQVWDTRIGDAGDATRKNVISANKATGIHALGRGVVGLGIFGNFIGTDAIGFKARGNQQYGIDVRNGAEVTIGQGQVVPPANLVSGNVLGQVRIHGVLTFDVRIQGNIIGSAIDLSPLQEGESTGHGILIAEGADQVLVGGPDPDDGNLLFFNEGDGLHVVSEDPPPEEPGDGHVNGTIIEHNTFARGDADGIDLEETSGAHVFHNEVYGNQGDGIAIRGPSAVANLLFDNFIGADFDGNPEGNEGHGVSITAGATDNWVGDLVIGPGGETYGNVIVANAGAGVYTHQATRNAMAFNTIDGNGGDGVSMHYSDPVFAYVANGVFHNSLQGNGGNGITLDAATLTRIHDNVIRSNGGHGVRLEGGSAINSIGGAATLEPNTIWDNGGDGVSVLDGIGNGIVHNSITRNGGLGIDLNDDGPTPNDPVDPDVGANFLQNYPVFTSIYWSAGGGLHVWGMINTHPFITPAIELYFNPDDPTEGFQFLGEGTTLTDEYGNGYFVMLIPHDFARPLIGGYLTLLDHAIEGGVPGNTSEFSPWIQVPPEPPPDNPPGPGDDPGHGVGLQLLLSAPSNDLIAQLIDKKAVAPISPPASSLSSPGSLRDYSSITFEAISIPLSQTTDFFFASAAVPGSMKDLTPTRAKGLALLREQF
jgi:hypothetical protein